MNVVHKVKMDLLHKQNTAAIDVMQGDGNARTIEFSLYSGGIPWNVPDGVSVAVAYLRPDGAKGIYDTIADGSSAVSVSGNTVSVVVVPQALAVAGETKLTVVFTADGEQLATFCVTLRVAANPAIGAVEPEDYINLRQVLIEMVEKAMGETGALPDFVVDVFGGEAGYFSDESFLDIQYAYNSGRTIRCRFDTGEQGFVKLPLVKDHPGKFYFSAVCEGVEYLVTISEDEAGETAVTVTQRTVGEGSEGSGKDGGYYLPTVKQAAPGTMAMSFSPSKSDMPTVPPVALVLPQGEKGDTGATGAAGKDGKDAVLTMFIAPNGSDSNDGLTASTPKKTVKACVTAGAKRISAKRGVYNEIVQLSNIGELEILPTDNDLTYAVGVEREPIVFDTSDSIAVSSLAAYNSIKRVAYSNSANTQFDKVFTKKSQTPIYGDGNGSRYNSTIWLLSSDEKTVCIKLKPVLTVAECEAEANTFTYVSGYIYINASMTSVAKIVVPTNWDCGIYINGAERFVLKEVEVRFAGSYNIDIRNCAYFDFYKCACKYTSYGSGFHPFNSNGKLTACYATKNYDGYGISGYGHTTYVDCVSEFNFDDGMSHHNATTGTVIGGRYEGNGKGGNTPAYGAKVNIYGGLYKDNASFGIGYLWAADLEPASGMVQGAVMVGNPVGLSVQKNCDVMAMNCTYKGNTTDTDAKGNLTEYNANYVKTINGVKPDENGNIEVEGM